MLRGPQFFHCRRLLEVETPVLSADTVVDRHLDPFGFEVTDVSGYGAEQRLWLQTSPEFGMKRLLASGAKASTRSLGCFAKRKGGRCTTPNSRWSSGTGLVIRSRKA